MTQEDTYNEEIESSRQDGRWSELIEIMNELSAYRAHFVVLLARLYRDMERDGK